MALAASFDDGEPDPGSGGDSVSYGSLEGLGGPRNFKKRPVLVLDAEELEEEHRQLYMSGASLVGEEEPAPRAERPAGLLGLAPMDENGPEASEGEDPDEVDLPPLDLDFSDPDALLGLGDEEEESVQAPAERKKRVGIDLDALRAAAGISEEDDGAETAGEDGPAAPVSDRLYGDEDGWPETPRAWFGVEHEDEPGAEPEPDPQAEFMPEPEPQAEPEREPEPPLELARFSEAPGNADPQEKGRAEAEPAPGTAQDSTKSGEGAEPVQPAESAADCARTAHVRAAYDIDDGPAPEPAPYIPPPPAAPSRLRKRLVRDVPQAVEEEPRGGWLHRLKRWLSGR